MTTNEHRRPLAPGEIRTHTVGRRTFQVMHVAGGSFTQASVREPGQPSRVLSTDTDARIAVNAYADAIEQAESDRIDALDDADGPSFTASGAFISDAPQDMSAHGVPEVEQRPTETGPLVLTLHEVPEGAVALIGRASGWRYERYLLTNSWRGPDGSVFPLAFVLNGEDPEGVTVEFAPPREPRTWPKLTDQSDDDLPDAVTIDDPDHPGVWRRCSTEGVLYTDGMSATTLADLRTFGDVTEVLG